MALPDSAARLQRIRRLIGMLDIGVMLLWAGRRQLALQAASAKREAGLPLRDRQQEAVVRRRTRRMATTLGMPPTTAARLTGLLIGDACRLQQSRIGRFPSPRTCEPAMPDVPTLRLPAGSSDSGPPSSRWLRLLPPPRRWAPLAQRIPGPLQSVVLQALLARALATPLATGLFESIDGRRIGVVVSDLDAGWTVSLQPAGIRVEAGTAHAECSVRGTATDLLLLASRLEDADTLFFHRRLQLTGDVELGLTVRNLLDQLPWEQFPLPSRILLHRLARLARAARLAHGE